jgi:hypothetical protein
MTSYAASAPFTAPVMTVVTGTFEAIKEVNSMTTATARGAFTGSSVARRAPHTGFDRMVARLAVAMLKWSRERAERKALTHEEHARLMLTATHTSQREADALRLTQLRG